MCEEMRTALNAYLDRELRGRPLLEMRTHLDSCETCQNELKELTSLSDYLRNARFPDFTPADRFAAQLALQLPRRSIKEQEDKRSSLIWWLAPLALIGLWFFIQIVITLSGAFSLMAQSRLLQNGTAWFSFDPQHAVWFSIAMNLFGNQLSTVEQSTLSIFDQVTMLGGNIFAQYLWQVIVVLLYWIWLAAWWLRTRGWSLFGTLVHL